MLTPEAVASDWVNREIGYALEQRKPILPVELRAVPRVGIELVTLHRENVHSGGMPSAAFIDRLRQVVSGRHLEPVHDPTTDDQPTDALRAEMRALAGVVFGIRFAKQALGRRGYDEDEVGAFLEQIARQLREGVGTITASDIDYVAFKKPPFGKRGYDEAEVDAFLDHVASAFRRFFPQQPAS